MKKLLSLLLTITLLAGCFAACNSQPVKDDSVAAPTAVEPTKEQVDDVVAESEEEQETDDKQQTEENKEPQEEIKEVEPVTKKESQKQDKPVASKTEEKDPEEQEETKWTAEEIHGDEVRHDPTFLSVEAFEYWMKNGGDYYKDEHFDVLQQSKNQTFTYYRPVENFAPYGELSMFDCTGIGEQHHYYYTQEDRCVIEIAAYMYNDSEFEQSYMDAKENYKNGLKGNYCIISNGIEYYYSDGSSVAIAVYWQQFGKTQHAYIYQNRDKIKEIIPLLQLEQVTINLNSNQVVK